MITLFKSNSANTIVTTFYERLNLYGLTGITGQTYWFDLENDLTKRMYSFSATDVSNNIWRYNAFIINEPTYDFTNGLYSYSGYADSANTQLLEVGRLLVSGTNTTNSIFW